MAYFKRIFESISAKKQIIGISLIFGFFFFLRLYHLGYHDLWYDELGTIDYARFPWYAWNAPLYWIFLHFWVKLFSISEFSLRFPSVMFSFFSVILVYVLGKALFNRKTGFIAGIFMGLSPFHIWYAQEARDYSMVLFLGLLSSWLFYKAMREDKLRLWIYFILASIAGLYTNYFYIFLFLSQCLYLIFIRRARLRFKEIVCFLTIIFGFCFYLSRFLDKFYYIWRGFWIPEPQWKSLLITLENFITGYNGFPALYFVGNLIAGTLFLSVLSAIYKKKELRKNFLFCLFLFFIPIAAAFLFSKIFFSIYLDRGFIIFSPYFYIILSLGIVSLKGALIRRILTGVLISLLFTTNFMYFTDKMFVPLEHHTGAYIKKPIKPIARFLDENTGERDIIAFTNESIMPSAGFYMKKKLSFYYFFDPRFLDGSWQRPMREGGYQISFNKINKLKFKSLWVIYCDWARSGKIDENSQSIKEYLDKNFKLKLVKNIDGAIIYKYIRKQFLKQSLLN
ncbi:MAG: glycosyltransferase family 39 protein [Candidatus Omnitrophota bacterium]